VYPLVEILDQFFSNVCEVNLLFYFNKVTWEPLLQNLLLRLTLLSLRSRENMKVIWAVVLLCISWANFAMTQNLVNVGSYSVFGYKFSLLLA
jgi:hypothetical protein